MKWYGSICNRIEENRQFVPTIEVGQGVTEYSWSDRDAYEVVAVKDQKHITIRRLGHKLKEGTDWYEQNWELFTDLNNPNMDIVKRGKYWYTVYTYIEDGKTKKHYNRLNISIGHADYYRDPSF